MRVPRGLTHVHQITPDTIGLFDTRGSYIYTKGLTRWTDLDMHNYLMHKESHDGTKGTTYI